jgi:hypothetical protein
MKKYNCLWCQKENNWGSSKTNKFCGSECCVSWQWEYVTKPRVLAGECTHNSVTVLKKFLIEQFGEKCSECGLTGHWNSKPIVLQLDHVDGDSDNNFPSNIRLLCPNCHSQTDNFGSKGKGCRYKKISKRNQYLQEYKGG